jgi:hypothetical protein
MKALLDRARLELARLTQREQIIVVAGSALLVLALLAGIMIALANATSKMEHRVRVKTKSLREVIALQDEYRARKAEQEARLRHLTGSQVRLVKLVEDAARQVGIEIGQINPEEGEPNDAGIAESRVALRADQLTMNKLQAFLQHIEGSRGAVVVKRLKVNKPFRKDTMSIDLEISSYRVEKRPT